MNILPLQPVLASRFENSGNVVFLNDEKHSSALEQQHDNMLSDFRNLFSSCRGEAAPQYVFERQMDIVLQRNEFDFATSKAIVRALSDDSCIWMEGVNFTNADGFEVLIEKYQENTQQYKTVERMVFDDSTAESLTQSTELTAGLRLAASDETLNPLFARNIAIQNQNNT